THGAWPRNCRASASPRQRKSKESSMGQPTSRSSAEFEQVLDTMIALTRPSALQRIIVAGDENLQLYLSLRRRGFLRVDTPATCRNARAQHAVGLVGGQTSLAEAEASLDEISRFLTPSAVVAVLVDSREAGIGLKIHGKLEQMGFRIEAGTRCQRGLVLCACRQ